ncbi:MAG: hypothetical protein ABR502_09055 [Chitinophagaceae bacterium]
MKRALIFSVIGIFIACTNPAAQKERNNVDSAKDHKSTKANNSTGGLDTGQYNRLQQYISNGDTTGRWPVKHEYPKAGAILPFKRIIAYYGNLYSTSMGALGEFQKSTMFKMLMAEVKKWSDADSVIKAIPALHYIAVTAQLAPGKDGKYRARMPFSQIDTVISWAKEINALVFIDVQVGLSTIQHELPEFEKYMSMPNVHLGIDPEFAMVPKGKRPGTVIGTYDASDINFTTNYLADLVKKHNLPPKILVIHRFTQGMVTNTRNIKLQPEVQIVMHMDGWGGHAKKIGTYRSWIFPEPVQFTGVKLFYKNDTERSAEKELLPVPAILNLVPKPVYIQYQ